MKHYKLTSLLTLLMSMVSANCFAQNELFVVDGIYYRHMYDRGSVDVVHPNATAVEEDDPTISIPSSYSGDITIPSEISGTMVVTDTYEWGDEYTHEEHYSYWVECIGSSAFYGSEITSIIIPNSVQTILRGAFARCTKLSSIIIPNSVVGVNDDAFYGCSGLNSVDIPQNVTYIGENAFAECDNLTSVTVRMEVPVSIDESVFSNRTNATLYVPAGCKEAYMSAPYWQDFKDIVEMSPIISFADYSVKNICVSKWDTDGDEELSEDEAAAVTSLGRAFKNNRYIKSFNELRYFTGLTSIQDEEFYYCTKLSSIIIPNNVTSIGRNAFFDCESLNSLTIPSSVNNIGNAAFLDCGLGLTSITVESGNTKYDSRNNCNAIIETKTNKLLWGCNNTIIPNSVTSIGNSAFSHCMLMTAINIPDGVTNIGNDAFYNCEKLASVVVPDLVTAIGDAAFWHCDDLLSVVIGEKVESIGNMAFHSCDKLTSVTVRKASPISITENVFTNRANATLYVPYGCKAAYEAADYWKEFKEIVEMEPTGVEVTDISQLDNVVYVEPTEERTGTEATISFKMKNTAAIRGFQFDLVLPEGVTPVEEDGEYVYWLNADRAPKKAGGQFYHTFEVTKQADGSYRFLCGAQADKTFKGNDGEVAVLKVNIADNMKEGDYPIILRNIKLTETDISNYYQTAEVITKLTIVNYIPGDISGDGIVDVSDYIGVANHILGNTPAGFNARAADVNNDNVIDVSDYIGIANIILTGSIYGNNNAARLMDKEGEQDPQ